MESPPASAISEKMIGVAGTRWGVVTHDSSPGVFCRWVIFVFRVALMRAKVDGQRFQGVVASGVYCLRSLLPPPQFSVAFCYHPLWRNSVKLNRDRVALSSAVAQQRSPEPGPRYNKRYENNVLDTRHALVARRVLKPSRLSPRHPAVAAPGPGGYWRGMSIRCRQGLPSRNCGASRMTRTCRCNRDF